MIEVSCDKFCEDIVMWKKIRKKYEQIPIPGRAAIWFTVCSFVQKGISAITVPIFTRLLSTEEYGKYNVFNTWFGILSAILTLSLYNGIYMQGMVKYDQDRKSYTSSLQGLTLVLVLMWICIYLCMPSFWNRLFGFSTCHMISLLILSWCEAVFGFWATEQRVRYRYVALVAVTILVTVVKPFLSIILVLLSDDKVTALILGMVIVELLAYGWMFFVHMAQGRKFFVKQYWIHAVVLAVPLLPHYLSSTILGGADRIMIQHMIGDSAAGIYSLAYSVAMLMIIFNGSLVNALNPLLYQSIKEGKIQEMKKMAYPSLAIIALINIALIIFAPEIIKIFAPGEYYEAVYIVPPAAMSVFFMFLYQLFACFEFYYEYSGYIAAATAVAAIMNIALNYVFIGIYGYYAAGYTTLVCYILYAFAHYCFMRRICRLKLNGEMPYNARYLILSSVAFMAVGFLFLSTYDYPVVRYAILAVIAVTAVVLRDKLRETLRTVLSLKKNLDE